MKHYDVVILGGAFSGASAAILLRRDRPDLPLPDAEKAAAFDDKRGEDRTGSQWSATAPRPRRSPAAGCWTPPAGQPSWASDWALSSATASTPRRPSGAAGKGCATSTTSPPGGRCRSPAATSRPGVSPPTT